MKDFARSINRLSAYLEPRIGYSNTFNTVAYYGPPDLRYLIVAIAVNKLGHKALFSAPRNSQPMHLHLLNATDCHTILHAHQIDVSSMVGTHKAVRHAIPELKDLLCAEDEPPHYPFTKTFEEAKNDPFLVLHTSGSTGMPKPIVESHGYATILDILLHMPPVNGVPTKASMFATQARAASVFPPWHVAGSILLGLCISVWGNTTNVWGPTDRMAGGKEVVEMVKYGNCTLIFAGQNVYESIVNNPEWLELMEKIDYAWYGGGT
jgi:acyl-coenzyme A synthetase/AMP-(fatty) acid ligase